MSDCLSCRGADDDDVDPLRVSVTLNRFHDDRKVNSVDVEKLRQHIFQYFVSACVD